MSKDNVVALPGFTIPDGVGEPNERIVEILSDLLTQAKAGEIKGLGLAFVIDDGSPVPMFETKFEFSENFRRTTFIACERLAHIMRKEMFG